MLRIAEYDSAHLLRINKLLNTRRMALRSVLSLKPAFIARSRRVFRFSPFSALKNSALL